MPEDYRAPLLSVGTMPAAEYDFLIYPRYWAVAEQPDAKVGDILRRHGIDSAAGYTRNGMAHGASLEPDQLAAVLADPQVHYVERDCVDHVAPYLNRIGEGRVEGGYYGWYTEGTDVVAMLARLGVTATHVFSDLGSFTAAMTDAERDRLRHEPELICLANDVWDSAC